MTPAASRGGLLVLRACGAFAVLREAGGVAPRAGALRTGGASRAVRVLTRP